jgi:hypothetical protein
MKRTSVALGILGLVYVLALPGANAAELWKPDLSKGKLEPPAGSTIYTQGVNDATKGADDTTKNYPGIKPFVVITDKDTANIFDNSCSCDKAKGWLDNGDSDGTTTHDLASDPAEKTYVSMLLTGDPTWADVSIQSKMVVLNQNTGTWGMVLRAAPKTKPEDPDSYYVLEYRSAGGDDEQLDSEIQDGIKPCTEKVKNRDGDGDEVVCMRIMKIVKGKWTMLADQGAATSQVHIPRVYRLGVDHDANPDTSSDGNGAEVADALTGYYFRFTAKGNVLTGSVSKDGQTWDQVLQATDNDLKAGQVGFMHYNYRPLTKEILVQDAP